MRTPTTEPRSSTPVCHSVDPEVFFAEAPADVEFAKALCGPCPVREACLAGALERREAAGVWGGELFVEGAVVARKRPRGRPRKNPLPVVVADREPAPNPLVAAPAAEGTRRELVRAA